MLNAIEKFMNFLFFDFNPIHHKDHKEKINPLMVFVVNNIFLISICRTLVIAT
jgi:hypothetical protein